MRSGPAILCAALLLTGCDSMFNSPKRTLQRAEQEQARGDYRSAIRFYEQALDGTPNTADLHYRLGLIYDDKLRDRVAAIHHFQRYIELQPKGSKAAEAKGFITQAQFNLRTSLSGGGVVTQQEAVRLKNENLDLRQQISGLRQQVSELRASRAKLQAQKPGVGKPSPAAAKPRPAPGSKSYVVQPGDTLASISRRFYKTSARWKDIQDANYNQLNGGVHLKPGQTLIIPK